LGASGTTYTAPANGWIVLCKNISANGQYCFMTNQDSKLCLGNSISSGYWGGYMPCKKGQKVKISYNLGGATDLFGFIYAEGEQ
jgi:hypothetical protein